MVDILLKKLSIDPVCAIYVLRGATKFPVKVTPIPTISVIKDDEYGQKANVVRVKVTRKNLSTKT